MSNNQNIIDQFKQDIENLHEVVSHLICRLKEEVKNKVTPSEGQKPICGDKQEIIGTTMKLTNMLARIFSLKQKLENGDKVEGRKISAAIVQTRDALGRATG
ncbi:MAG: hypothetical protein K0R98_1111 [Rickettsiaceae bacterium]|jgi:hypothetical protein|nr:hypothetical protein [Rickettsiaceae bacterium]